MRTFSLYFPFLLLEPFSGPKKMQCAKSIVGEGHRFGRVFES